MDTASPWFNWTPDDDSVMSSAVDLLSNENKPIFKGLMFLVVSQAKDLSGQVVSTEYFTVRSTVDTLAAWSILGCSNRKENLSTSFLDFVH